MRKLLAAMKLSLDGMVSDAEGSSPWVEAWSEDYGLTPRIDACLLAGGMYAGYERYWTAMQAAPDQLHPMSSKLPTPEELDWCRRVPDLPHYVLSSGMDQALWPNTCFLWNVKEIEALKGGGGKDIYLVGGAQLIGSLLDEGLVDELHLITYPFIAGGGTALFTAACKPQSLRLRAFAQLGDGRLHHSYEVG